MCWTTWPKREVECYALGVCDLFTSGYISSNHREYEQWKVYKYSGWIFMTSCCQTIWKLSFYFLRRQRPMSCFFEDNYMKTENNLDCLDWPWQSPDIIKIENVWRMLKIRLKRSLKTIRNRDDLVREAIRIWESLTVPYIRDLYHTIPRQIQAVIASKGHITKYWIFRVSTVYIYLIRTFASLLLIYFYKWRQVKTCINSGIWLYSMWTNVIPLPSSSLYISYKTTYFHSILMKSFLSRFSWNFHL